MPRKWTYLVAVLGLVGILMASGCATQGQTGALVGSLIGAGLGQAIGSDTEATLIGAAVAAGAGYMLGNEQDKLAPQGWTSATVLEPVRVVAPVYVVEPMWVVDPAPSRFVVVYHSRGHRPPPPARRHPHGHR